MLSLMIPLEHMTAVTKSDATVYSPPLRALYVGGTGNVKIKDAVGNTVTLVALAAGVVHPIRATMVFSTDTTATDIVGAY